MTIATNSEGNITSVTGKYNNEAGNAVTTNTKLDNSLGKVATTSKETSSETVSLTDKVGKMGGEVLNAVGKMALWAIAGTILFGTLRKIGDGIQYVKDLNKEMTNIAMITGDTIPQTDALAASYHNLAMELASTTLEIAKGAEVWLRQGKSAADTLALTAASIQMSKLAMTDSASAASYLTAILNGFQMQASDVTGVMNKMLALSNSTKTSAAVSFDTISAAMQVSSSEANNVGISFDKLAAMIGTIGTVTQQSGETIGNSLDKFGALWYN